MNKMPQLSNVKNAMQTVVRKDRLLNAVFAGGKALVVSLARTAYTLWLEMTGLIFAVFTVMGSSGLWKQYRADHFADRHRFYTVLAFTLVCGWFTLMSFRRARKTQVKR